MRSIDLAAAALAAICLAPVCLSPGGPRRRRRRGADGAAMVRQLPRRECRRRGPSAPIPQGPPAFATIAGHMTPDRLRTFLSHPHGAMPDLALTRAEINDLIDYIQTLQQ